MEALTRAGVFVPADDPCLRYMGRIDFSDPRAPIFLYASSCVFLRFAGTGLSVILKNKRLFYRNFVGFSIDGRAPGRAEITRDGEAVRLELASGLENREHEAVLFKRMDSCHQFEFYGFLLNSGSRVLPALPLPERKLEFYGDSVTCGEVCEAVEYVGKQDPAHNGEYSNAWYSYAMIAARKLNAQVHNVSQGGIALLDGAGYFCEPKALGMESCYDKLNYNPQLGPLTEWDFSRYTPQAVVVAVGQNDAHPEDYIRTDAARRRSWKEHYKALVRNLRGRYPEALLLLTTTILFHDSAWDDCIGEAAQELADPRAVHFLYGRNGSGTPGHIRIPEAEEMAGELSGYLESLGDSVWRPGAR